MKMLFFISIIGLIGTQTQVMAQTEMKIDSIKQRLSQVNALNKRSVKFDQIKETHKIARFHKTQSQDAVEQITLTSGVVATYQTTDNAKIRSLLEKLFSMSPVDFLLAIKGIEGKIVIKTSRLNWVKKEDIPLLVKLTTVDLVTPWIKQEDPMVDNVNNPFYTKIPMGINALDLIDNYLSGVFPAETPSYSSVKLWYDSGKPKEAYKFESYIPYIKEPVFPLDTTKHFGPH